MLPAPHPVFGQVGVVLVPIRSGTRCRFTPLSSELNLVPVVADLDVEVEVWGVEGGGGPGAQGPLNPPTGPLEGRRPGQLKDLDVWPDGPGGSVEQGADNGVVVGRVRQFGLPDHGQWVEKPGKIRIGDTGGGGLLMANGIFEGRVLRRVRWGALTATAAPSAGIIVSLWAWAAWELRIEDLVEAGGGVWQEVVPNGGC